MAPLSCIAFGAGVTAVVAHLPALWLLLPAFFASFFLLPQPVAVPASELIASHTPVGVIAYWTVAYIVGFLVPIGMALMANLSRNERTRRRFYQGFLGLLIIDVGLALLSPFLYLMILGAGE